MVERLIRDGDFVFCIDNSDDPVGRMPWASILRTDKRYKVSLQYAGFVFLEGVHDPVPIDRLVLENKAPERADEPPAPSSAPGRKVLWAGQSTLLSGDRKVFVGESEEEPGFVLLTWTLKGEETSVKLTEEAAVATMGLLLAVLFPKKAGDEPRWTVSLTPKNGACEEGLQAS